MDSFENLVAMLLRREGYWTMTCVKVELEKDEKRQIGRHSSPRWEIDVVAYKGGANELLAVECKSFLDSPGVRFSKGHFDPPERYKLFEEKRLREVVLARLERQLIEKGACRPGPKVVLGMAIGKVASGTSVGDLRAHFDGMGWALYTPAWIRERLRKASEDGYENDMAYVVSKLLLRSGPACTADD